MNFFGDQQAGFDASEYVSKVASLLRSGRHPPPVFLPLKKVRMLVRPIVVV